MTDERFAGRQHYSIPVIPRDPRWRLIDCCGELGALDLERAEEN